MLSRQLWQLRPLLILITLCGVVYAQPNASLPTVTFTLDFPKSDPSHYVVTIASDGYASYEGNGLLTARSDDEPVDSGPEPSTITDFKVSQSLVNRIFDLAKRADYFQGNLDSNKRNLAYTGAKTLSYKDAQRSAQATYNYSPQSAVQELTNIFQNLSSTIEFGRRLEYYHQHQKLALDRELKRMEEFYGNGGLEEVTAIAPILRRIADDHSVINVVRSRALRLLAKAETPVRR